MYFISMPDGSTKSTLLYFSTVIKAHTWTLSQQGAVFKGATTNGSRFILFTFWWCCRKSMPKIYTTVSLSSRRFQEQTVQMTTLTSVGFAFRDTLHSLRSRLASPYPLCAPLIRLPLSSFTLFRQAPCCWRLERKIQRQTIAQVQNWAYWSYDEQEKKVSSEMWEQLTALWLG